MKETKIIKVKTTDLSVVAGVNPADIAVVYGGKVYANSQTAFTCLVDLDDLPSWGDVANPREYYLGDVTYIPEDDVNGDTKYISVDWGDRIYGGYATLTPLKGVEVEVVNNDKFYRPCRSCREGRK